MQIEQWLPDRGRLRLVALVTAVLLPTVAVGQGADELASTIEQSFDSIEFRIDIRPEQAASDLEAKAGSSNCSSNRRPSIPRCPSSGRSSASCRTT